jgi:hypothetical protein
VTARVVVVMVVVLTDHFFKAHPPILNNGSVVCFLSSCCNSAMHKLASSCLPSLSATQYRIPSEKALEHDRILASSSACSNNKLIVHDDGIVYSLSRPQVIEESVSVSYPLNLFFPSKLKSRYDVSK